MGIRPERGATGHCALQQRTSQSGALQHGAAHAATAPKTAAFRIAGCAALLALALTLGGCAGDSPLAFLGPKVPDVPKVEPANYLSVGEPKVDRRPVLTPADQAKLLKDLEDLSKDNGKSVEEAIEKGT